MSQRKALIASLIITLVLALSAIGIRAALVDSSQTPGDTAGALTLVQPGSGEYDDDRYEDSESTSGYEDSEEDTASQDSDDDGDHDREDDEGEENDDDGE